MPAPDAVGSGLCQIFIMIGGESVARARQIVIFVDRSHVYPREAGLAVVAVHAFARRVLRANVPMTE